ncbi:MAG: hypothetical protein A1D16_18920 [Flavihumibacter sp. CACIAM 22H1]|nr:MAG: hypothetical protein A1D16_18920 [Flavihumibacter sp. CACIAM 22H1]
MPRPDLLAPLLILFLSLLTVKIRLLNMAAALSGALIAWCIWLGTGLNGLVLLAVFFVSGAGVTRLVRTEKKAQGADRKASQVWANGGVAAVLGLLACIIPNKADYYLLLLAAAIAAATGDTLSSELGTRYGKRFFNCISWKPDQRGADGVISWEGIAFGILGSGLIALVAWLLAFDGEAAILILVAGIAGNLSDSFMGARWQRKGYLNNDLVNLLNTVVAVVCIILLILAF